MPLSTARVVQDEDAVEHALSQIGLTKKMVITIAREATAARAEALPIDPVSAPGWFSYAYGVRHTRLQLLPKDNWRMSRLGNVESTVNDELGVQICFQNVDSACNPNRIPHAISRKGTAARQLVANGQGDLFSTPDTKNLSKLGCTPAVWVICVEASDAVLKVEVSCPTSFEGSQFEEFHERIFVLEEHIDDSSSTAEEDDTSIEEVDVPVSKK